MKPTNTNNPAHVDVMKGTIDNILTNIREKADPDELNRLKKDASPVLKILITAYTTEDVVARARDIGLDGFIKKPFNAHDIEELLERLMENPVLGN